nr:hypothetical protein [Streptomyces tsukubensis]
MNHTPGEKGFRARYGASPVHLLLVLCSFALTVYAGMRLLKGDTLGVVVWFVGAALLHDLVLLPLYTVTDKVLAAVPGLRRASGAAPWINYVRVPAFVALLLLLVWYPLVLRRVPAYPGYTGLPDDVFLGRWLLITAALFALSAVCLLIALLRRGRAVDDGGPSPSRRPDGPSGAAE